MEEATLIRAQLYNPDTDIATCKIRLFHSARRDVIYRRSTDYPVPPDALAMKLIGPYEPACRIWQLVTL